MTKAIVIPPHEKVEFNNKTLQMLRTAKLGIIAIENKLRIRILEFLRERKRSNVTDLIVHLRCEQSVASQHLAILRRAGVVDSERIGKQVFYVLNETRLEQLTNAATKIAIIAR